MDEETISLATLRAYLWYAANMDIFLQSIALSASHVPFIKEAKKEKQIIQDKDMKALLAVPQIRKKETVIRTKGVCPHKCRVKFLKVF